MKPLEELGISPAPWRQDERVPFCEDNVILCEYHGEGGHRRIRRVAHCNDKFSEEQARIDARLIAAAPELYEALRLCVGEMCKCCKEHADRPCVDMCEAVRMARAALEKAGGRE